MKVFNMFIAAVCVIFLLSCVLYFIIMFGQVKNFVIFLLFLVYKDLNLKVGRL